MCVCFDIYPTKKNTTPFFFHEHNDAIGRALEEDQFQ